MISFLFALVLWYFVVGVDKVDRTIGMPVEIINLPENLIITNQFKKEIEIRVKGPLGLIRKMEKDNIRRTIDLSDASPGSRIIKNTNENLPIPDGIRLLNISPRNIILRIDKLIDKKIPLNVKTSGQVATGYEVTRVSVSPRTIHVTGPQAIMENLDSFATKPVNLDQRSSSFQVSTLLDIPQPVTELIGEPVVDVRITIDKRGNR
ncbi:MAG: CdaR family protein [Thermodesulfobacteriota bacterium]